MHFIATAFIVALVLLLVALFVADAWFRFTHPGLAFAISIVGGVVVAVFRRILVRKRRPGEHIHSMGRDTHFD